MDITVLLVDDHAIFREGLRMVLEAQEDITVVGEAEDGREAISLVEQLLPTVVVMDIAMPNLNGLEATHQISRRFPDVKVVILTMHSQHQYLTQIVRVGAIGCVLKSSAGKELVAAVKTAAAGGSYFSPAMSTALLKDYRLHLASDCTGEIWQLTEREREILQLIAEGRTSQETADLLTLSVKTVQTHRAHILKKLGVHDRTDLVKVAIRAGIITSDQ